MSPELAEALRNEIRVTLEAEGKPFDVNVARRVYDLAIAARDMCVAASNTVKEAIDQITDMNGPMETIDSPDTPESQMQVAETFGARIMRELLAIVPTAFRQTHEDPHALIAAIADARDRGMHDLAAKLAQKLVGTPLEVPKPKVTLTEVVDDSYEHGFLDGSMQDNFDRGTINGHVARDPRHASPAYRDGFAAGLARRQSGEAVIVPPTTVDSNGQHVPCDHPNEALFDAPYDDGYQVFCRICGRHVRLGRLASGEGGCDHPAEALYEAPHVAGHQVFCRVCAKHIRLGRLSALPTQDTAEGGVSQDDDRAGRKHARPPSGMENAFDPAFENGGQP